MKKIFLIILLISLFTPVFVFAVDNYGLDKTAGAAKLKTNEDLPATAGKVIGTLLSLIGVFFFALMIYGGFMWMTAQGKEEQAKKALDTIIAAVIGLVIILAAYAITSFIFKSVQSTGGGSTTTPITDSSKCLAKGTDYDCRDSSECDNDTIITGLCPGGTQVVCCKQGT